jgi:hypothetical protein
MTKGMIFILLYISLCCCKSTTTYKEVAFKSIKGSWILITESPTLNYPGIAFRDNNSAVFSSFGDTIYYFKYALKMNDLILEDGEKKISHNIIAKLTYDTLVFKNLLEHRTAQVYIRDSKN